MKWHWNAGEKLAHATLVGFLLLIFQDSGSASITWTNAEGGLWHEPFWSGGMPGEGAIVITNAGSKTITINSETSENFPQTLIVSDLTLAAPVGSTNILSMKHVGVELPLDIRGILKVQANGELNVIGSSFKTHSFYLFGSASQSESSSALVGGLLLSSNSTFNLYGGVLQVAYLGIGHTYAPATFNQLGGTNLCNTFVQRGNYNMWAGRLEAQGPINIGATNSYQSGVFQESTFNQYGGVVNGTVLLGSNSFSQYTLAAGLRSGGSMRVTPTQVSAGGSIYQTGGTNIGDILLSSHFDLFQGVGFPGSYSLVNGEVWSSNVTIRANCSFLQKGGAHRAGIISLSGWQFCQKQQPGYDYSQCPIYMGGYRLSDGTLIASNIVSSFGGSFSQRAGELVTGLFQAGGTTVLSGGQADIQTLIVGGSFINGNAMVASNIYLTGGIFQQRDGNLTHQGFLMFSSGSWIAGPGEQELGYLFLNALNTSTGYMVFPTNACTIRFLESSSITWSNRTQLVISNWNGSFSGNGGHQLKFGNDATGLSSAQTSQIFFESPAGIAGRYPARILASGEVVPTFVLSVESSGTAQQLRWNTPFILQTSANIDGPYEDVIGAASPYTVEFTEPQRFFRLRN